MIKTSRYRGVLPTTKKSRLTERASIHLDMARGLAALAVLVGHVRGFFFVSYHELPHHSPLIAAVYALTTMGHQAVIAFFVLSGFFIVPSVTDAFEQQRWSWTGYLTNRVTRLSLVLIPSLILCWIVDRIGMALPATASLYEHPPALFFSQSVASLETARNFAGSFFYLQDILTRPFGSNAPLWSLSYEFWYYIIFPLAVCALVKRFRPTTRIVYLALAIFVMWFVGRAIALYFLIWLLGGAIALSRAVKWSPVRFSGAGIAAVAPLALALGLSIARPLSSPFEMDAVVALAFGLWVYATFEAQEKPLPAFYAKSARLFAGFSYTLYLTHFPLVFLLRAWIIRTNLWKPDFLHLLYGLAIATGAVVIAYGIAQGTETKTAVVRHKVIALFDSVKRPAPAKS